MSLEDVLKQINSTSNTQRAIANKRIKDLHDAIEEAKKGEVKEDAQQGTVPNSEENSQQVGEE